MFLEKGNENKKFTNILINSCVSKKWRQLSSIGAIWLCDLYGTNFYKFYGRFKEIGLLEVEAIFHWLYEFGLDVLLGIDANF